MSKREQIVVSELAAGDTTTTEVQGSSSTIHMLEPVSWLKEIMKAARSEWYFAQLAKQVDVPEGTKEVVIPYKKKYLETTDFANTYSAGAEITATKLNSNDGVKLTPSPKTQRISIENHALRTNAVNIIADAKEELINYAANVVENDIVTAILGATMTDATTAGAQLLYGGTHTSDATLTDGDVLTPELVSKAKSFLRSKRAYYWNSGVLTLSSASKNPWKKDARGEIVLFITPEIEHSLRLDSQFTDASQYGSNEVVLTGEIGKYMGVKVIVSDFVPTYSTGTAAPDGSGNVITNIARTIMVKQNKAYAIAWGLKPTLKVSPFDREASVDIILELTYAADTVYDDAIVFIDVSQF